MFSAGNLIPLSLYIHFPWCIRKCPYCDFNSHTLRGELPERQYINALIEDLKSKLSWIQKRPIHSIFMGGGTPSLFTPDAIALLFEQLHAYLTIPNNTEITMEVNPGTVEQQRFKDFFDLGINRLSIGIQSFNDVHLKKLGRVHNSDEARRAIDTTRNAGFKNFNLDLMFGLSQQKIDEALQDLEIAMQLKPTHLSWYQLTLEPNTFFYKHPPKLPQDDYLWEMQEQGQSFLQQCHYQQYEISAYSQNQAQCIHNLNYWEFGDYLGIGAGAHGKITDFKNKKIYRHYNFKQPKSYSDPKTPYVEKNGLVAEKELPLEFMMNALRLEKPVKFELFTERTFLNPNTIKNELNVAYKKQLLLKNDREIQTSKRGKRYLNDLLELFLSG